MTGQSIGEVIRPKRSVALSDEQKQQLNEYLNKYSTLVDAAVSIGMDRGVLERVILRGSSSEKTFDKLKDKVFS